jgi:hypothetical protein
MKFRTLALAGTAALALAATAPVFAQDQTASPANSSAPTTTVGKDATKAADEVDRAAGIKDRVTRAELANAVSLKNVENPQQTLAASEIKNRAGEPIGQVHRVEVGSDGSVQAIDADVGGFLGVGERVVSIAPNHFVYLKDRNLLVTRMTKSEIQNLQPTGM